MSMGASVADWRQDRRARTLHLAQQQQPLQEAWRASLDPQVRKLIGAWHMPLMHVLAFEAGSEDLFFTSGYSVGVTSLGRAMHSVVMPLKNTRPLRSVEDLHAQASSRTAALLRSVRSSGDAILDAESLRKTHAEIDAGTMLGPWRAARLPS